MGKRLEVVDLPEAELAGMLARVSTRVEDADYQLIQRLAETVPLLLGLIAQQDMSLGRLRRLLFGARTERTATVLPQAPPTAEGPAAAPKTRPKGHGRHGKQAYSGARHIPVPHPSLRPGDPCPACLQSKVYRLSDSGVVLRIVGQAPVAATLYALEKLRCRLCGQVFTAPPPTEAGPQKYDDTVCSLLALLRYGSGLPFHRIEKLQESLGVPLPAATQWELVETLAQEAAPVYQTLIARAAQGQLLHNDDTTMTVQSLRSRSTPDPAATHDAVRERTGIFTSGIVARTDEHSIALFFTGRQHAGQNLNDLLRQREANLPPPIQMCDGLSRNEPQEFAPRLSNCLVHGRRNFVEAAPSFPDQCRHVLETLREVYRNEAQTQRLTPEDRLAFHRAHSQPLLEDLHLWMQNQLDEKTVEPNSGLGQALTYMLKRWEPLTLFLRQPDAPLDNNLCEPALKMAILHRKNSLAYKTQHGADVGDLFMSLIHTCRLCGANPFDYLTALARHPRRVKEHPAQWLPWNYRQALPGDNTS
jgi:transposase